MKENKKITIVTTGHPAKDDRIYYRFAKSLQKAGMPVSIITTLEDIQENGDTITIAGSAKKAYCKKTLYIIKQLFSSKPDFILCAEVFAILPAFIFKVLSGTQATIHLDITEWYPENILKKKSALLASILKPLFYLMMVIAGLLINGYIFGENKKLSRWLLLSPGKPHAVISYFPDLKYFFHHHASGTGGTLSICFAGLFTAERGFFRFIEVIKKIAGGNPDRTFTGLAIGKFISPRDEQLYNNMLSSVPENVTLTLKDWVPYEELSEVYKTADIFVELRDDTFFYRNSLPIKLFEFMAMGRPVIYSENDAIKEVLDIEQVGAFVNPNALEEVAKVLQKYIDHPSLIQSQGNSARKLAVEKFNWNNEEKKLLHYIDLF
jgi:glycosyltransferase involved in cell wall biosynthesis